MNYLSICSGIEAATVAWHPLRWNPVAFAEIEKFPSAVLDHHYPSVPNLGDMTKFKDWPLYENERSINLLVGGTPCQAFSVAGLRKGLDDPRGNLTLGFLALARRYRPRWVVWENVPGVLSDRTNAFGEFLSGLAELGYGWAFRVLDAQYFGVAQRRRRVFVVGYLGDWQRAAAVLFEPESLRGDSPPGRETGQGTPRRTADCLTKCRAGSPDEVRGMGNQIAHSLRADGFDASEDGTGRGTPLIADTVRSHPRPGSNSIGQCIPIQEIGKRQSGTPMNGVGHGKDGDPMFTLQQGAQHHVALPAIVGTLSDGAHHGGGLNGQDAYTGRIIAVSSLGVAGAGREGSGQFDQRGSPDSDPSRRFL